MLSILNKQSRGVSGSVNTFKLPSLENPDHSLWSNSAGWSQSDTLSFLSAGKMRVGERMNKHTHKVTVPSCAEKAFPVEEILDGSAVVLLHPGAHQGLLMCLDVTLPVCTRDDVLHRIVINTAAHKMLFLVEANLGRDKTAEIICGPVLYPNASPPSTSAGGTDQEGHPGDTFPALSISMERLAL